MDRAALVEVLSLSTPEPVLRIGSDGFLARLAEAEMVALLQRAATLWALTHPDEAEHLRANRGATSTNAFLGWAEGACLDVVVRR